MRVAILALTLAVAVAPCAFAQDHNAEVEELLKEFTWPGAVRMPIGVTAKGTLIWCVMDEKALDYKNPIARYLLVVGLNGDPLQRAALLAQVRECQAKSPKDRAGYPVAIVVIADPDRWFAADKSPERGSASSWEFPPQGEAYHSQRDVEAAVLWRFTGWFAPDVVAEVLSDSDPELRRAWDSGDGEIPWPKTSLAAAVGSRAVWQSGTAHSVRLPVHMVGRTKEWGGIEPQYMTYSGVLKLSAAAEKNPLIWRSAARTATISRLDRTPGAVAAQLSQHYGDHLRTVMYQPALALVGRMRLGDLTNDSSHQEAVGRVLASHLAGSAGAVDKAPNGSEIAGHLVFADWALRTGDERAVVLVKRAADHAFNADGSPREAMPSHNEMSDAVFMGCPILTAAGRLTGDPKYLDMAATHLAFMRTLCLRDDGIYRHSPLCETAWGRGNGFPALGLALCLTDLDAIAQDEQGTNALKTAAARVREQMLPAYRAHVQALLPHQDLTGTWRQVIDHPGAYRELTATCMITFAMARGLRQGWLDGETYRPVVDRAWEAIKVRVGSDGTLFDVCTGTGKQKTLQDYLDRTAILGQDERGGAMALLAAVEIAALQAESRPSEPRP